MKGAALKANFEIGTFKGNRWSTERGKQNAGPRRAGGRDVTEGHTRSLEGGALLITDLPAKHVSSLKFPTLPV